MAACTIARSQPSAAIARAYAPTATDASPFSIAMIFCLVRAADGSKLRLGQSAMQASLSKVFA